MKTKILCAGLCMSLFFGANAFAETISFDLRGQKISGISMESSVSCDRPTITLFNTDKTTALYVNDGTAEKTNGVYVLKFDDFKIPSKDQKGNDVATGTLYLKIGGENITATLAEVNYKSPNDIYNALNNNLDKANTTTIHSVMLLWGKTAGADLTYYEKMPQDWYDATDGAVLSLDLSVEDDLSDLYDKQEQYIKVVKKFSNQYVVAASEDRTKAVELIKKSDDLGFDRSEFYGKTDAETIAAYIKGKNVAPNSADADLPKLFDESVLVQCIKTLDWKTAESALKYYKSKSRFTYDFTNYDKLSELEKIDVIGKLKNTSGVLDFSTIPQLLSAAVPTETNPSTDGNAHTPAGGGGGSYSPPAKDNTDDEKTEENKEISYNSSSLKDLDDAKWAREAIETLYNRNIVSGYDDGNYYPDTDVTREQFVKTAVSAFEIDPDGEDVYFDDVERNAWYYRYIKAACNAGIISGIGDNKFGVGMNITREDMAVIICRTLEYCGMETEEAALTFTDSDQIAEYAKTAVAFLADKGIVNGIGDGSFSPKSYVTRAQMAVIVCNALDAYQAQIGG